MVNKIESASGEWFPTACIVCPENCGLEVQIKENQIVKVRGDKNHPKSKGYCCHKALRINYYQNSNDRLTHPLRKTADGGFEKISWEVAINEIARKLLHIRDTYGGRSFAYYGGGTLGNHIGGLYAVALKAAMGSPFHFSSIAQEKTGDFYINGKLFGRQTCHVADGVEEAEVVVFLGTNPWQSHGFPRARRVINDIRKDPNRKIVVIDPRRTETAQRADFHLALKPGTDVFLLSAILAYIVQENLVDQAFIDEHTKGFEPVKAFFQSVDIEGCAKRAGIELALVRQVADIIGRAQSVTVKADLGIQQSFHSTVNSYLEKLLFLLTGNFGKKGCNNLHSFIIPIIGHSPDPTEIDDTLKTPVTRMYPISKLYPPNILPAEIDSDNAERIRAVYVDSANPLLSAADSQAYRKAFEKLELLVVVDVAMTETAELADYVLPAPSQFEKYEATFYSYYFPENFIHLRKPIFPPRGESLPEPEIYRRLLVAMDELPESFPFLESVAWMHRIVPKLQIFPLALKSLFAMKPDWQNYGSVILSETLGKTLPDDAQNAAPIWMASLFYVDRHREAVLRAGIEDEGFGLGESFFRRIIEDHSGLKMSHHEYEETWKMVRTKDKKIHLDISEMLEELRNYMQEIDVSLQTEEFPFLLSAGERRKYNANTLLRDPAWRLSDTEGCLVMNPDDAQKLGINAGDMVKATSSSGSIITKVFISDETPEGFCALPHGYGMKYKAGDTTKREAQGPNVNDLTSTAHCDSRTKTPYHKHVPVNLEKV